MTGRRSLTALALAAVVAAGVVAGVSVGTSRPAAGAAAEIYPLPVTGSWSVIGKGFGHGRGMSQWGSQGAAMAGLTTTQILNFYYPGTTQTAIASAPIRVLISADEGVDTAVGAIPDLHLRDVASNRVYEVPTGPTRWRAVADAAGLHVDSFDGTTWTRWRAPDGLASWAGPLRFGAGEITALTLYIGQTPVRYRGTLSAVRTGTTTVETVNTVPLDVYLYSVVPAESPASWLTAALRAQAIAARTYAARTRALHAADPWDICDTTACQVYKGVSSEAATTTSAVQTTANLTRTLGGQLILAEFSASNGGWTVAGSVPYQVAKLDPYDYAGGTNPNFPWTASLSAGEVAARYPQIGTPRYLRVLSRDGNGYWGGRITGLAIEGSAGSVTLTGSSVRLTFKSIWWIPRPTASAPATATLGSTVLMRGTARPGAAVQVWFHRPSTTGYFKGRDLVADATGRWSTNFTVPDDTRYYAVSYGVRSTVGLTQVS